ncbi:MAG: hypothetical protein C4560_00285 [Nitrospiraceae bacterium]|nr:MAG: hypothetical protein C4560_00285 [Nitrospiraceae bacterium]
MQENNSTEIRTEPEEAVKHDVVGIRFRACGRIYTFEIGDIDAPAGSQVVVESEMGLSIGRVVRPKHTVEKTDEPLKKVIRLADEKDFESIKDNRSLENEAKTYCIGRTKELKLPMKIVAAETTLDKKRFIFYFSAEGRIDFRELVRDLASKFKTRIEMRQIGVRDEVKLLGGIGVCGRQTCCSLFLTSFEPVTIKMAKQQDLSINQSKLSGICGRLMCCLGYECKDGPEAVEVPAVRDEDETHEDMVTIAEGLSPSQAEAGTVSESRPADDRRGADKTATGGAVQERSSGKRRHSRRGHRGAGRQHSPEKALNDKPPHDSAPQGKPPGEGGQGQKQPEGGAKGKPFNKRRRFWKKKKNDQK